MTRDPAQIYAYLTGEPPELVVARMLHAQGDTETTARQLFTVPPLNRLPDPLVLNVINHLRDLRRGI